ncbi:MAG TPA: DUF2313 domain-containing protein [Syntrophales bacterium]|nr:DUF2313 domain-containing protein [Syntrophales bacterium]
MNHSDILKLLFPLQVDPESVLAGDIALEGGHLDTAQDSADGLLQEAFPDRSTALLASWERVCGIVPGDEDPLQARRNAVIRQLRSMGGLSRAYFIALAASYGWTITIDELLPFMCGWNRCGNPLYEDSVRWIWRVNVSGQAVYSFRAGLSAAGERLTWWIPNTRLEQLFQELKPAHSHVIFNYE